MVEWNKLSPDGDASSLLNYYYGQNDGWVGCAIDLNNGDVVMTNDCDNNELLVDCAVADQVSEAIRKRGRPTFIDADESGKIILEWRTLKEGRKSSTVDVNPAESREIENLRSARERIEYPDVTEDYIVVYEKESDPISDLWKTWDEDLSTMGKVASFPGLVGISLLAAVFGGAAGCQSQPGEVKAKIVYVGGDAVYSDTYQDDGGKDQDDFGMDAPYDGDGGDTLFGCPDPEETCTVEGVEGKCGEGVSFCTEDEFGNVTWSECETDPDLITDEICNGEDDDCDGVVDNFGDEGVVGDECVKISGQNCISEGELACNEDFDPEDSESSPLICDAPDIVPMDELCDGKDNNCNGKIDESLVQIAPLQEGVCLGAESECEDGDWVAKYGADYEATETGCDGLDNDCDGDVDEELPASPASKTEGVCEGATKICAGEGGFVDPNFEEIVDYEDVESSCDGLDNDCNGFIDDGLSAPQASLQEGACIGSAQVCYGVNGWADPDYFSIPNYQEVETDCDGIDNDCDGYVDKKPGETSQNLTAACLPGGASDNCLNGVKTCFGGEWDECVPTEIVPEKCDGLDNDCNNEIDEGLEVPLAIKQAGICAGSVKVCAGASGWLEPNYSANPAYEVVESGCDGLDNDCDTEIDENLIAPLADNQFGICGGSEKICGGELGWQNPDYTSIPGYEPVETACDGIDNDCDGETDKGLEAPLADYQDGVCEGAKKICDGFGGWVEPDYTTIPGYASDEDACDGLDNDCDGKIDEDLVEPLANKQAGICAGMLKVCAGELGWIEPNYSVNDQYEEVESACDGLDNDCDGLTDQGLLAPIAPKQDGLCLGSVMMCAGEDGWIENYSYIPGYEDVETACDGEDNDCDGKIDEDLVKPPADNQNGVCENSVKICGGEAGWMNDYSAIIGYEPNEDACDGLDNDCDTQIDEMLTPPLADKQAGVCKDSVKICAGVDGWQNPDYMTLVGYEPDESNCDGLDNDCDGAIDEGMDDAPLADNQNGVCAGTTKVCDGLGGWTEPNYSSVQGYESVETGCDGLDNDCDGQEDESLTPPLADNQNGVCKDAVKLCGGDNGWLEPDYTMQSGYEAQESACDGLDNDCDGQEDEDVVAPLASKQLGVCLGSLQVCGGELGWVEPDYNETIDNYEIWESACDGLDNDCDGEEDESLWAPLAPNQTGVCEASLMMCAGETGWIENYSAIPGYELVETLCDGLDNNCDGSIDEDLPDADGDGVCDLIDNDADNDGIDNDSDNCVTTPNPLQGNMDGDAFGDACDGDIDGDGVLNVEDNCELVANENQNNIDGDEFGDVCDDDMDGDGILNGADNCETVPNPIPDGAASQVDWDEDGIGYECDDVVDLLKVTADSLALCNVGTTCAGIDQSNYPAYIYLTNFDGDVNVSGADFTSLTDSNLQHEIEFVGCPDVFTPLGEKKTYVPGDNFEFLNWIWKSGNSVFIATSAKNPASASKFSLKREMVQDGGSCFEYQYKYPCDPAEEPVPQCIK